MAMYDYKCKNEKCYLYDKVKTASIPMAEYSEAKLPKCECCEEPTARVYTAGGMLRTFGDGVKL